MNFVIRNSTETHNVNGIEFPIAEIKMGEDWKRFYVDAEGTHVEIDDSINDITIGYSIKEEVKVIEDSIELAPVNNGTSILSVHEYHTPKDATPRRAIASWYKTTKFGGKWIRSNNRGALMNMGEEHISTLNTLQTRIGWIK